MPVATICTSLVGSGAPVESILTRWTTGNAPRQGPLNPGSASSWYHPGGRAISQAEISTPKRTLFSGKHGQDVLYGCHSPEAAGSSPARAMLCDPLPVTNIGSLDSTAPPADPTAQHVPGNAPLQEDKGRSRPTSSVPDKRSSRRLRRCVWGRGRQRGDGRRLAGGGR